LATGQKHLDKKQKAPTFVGASEIEAELGNLANDQTNPEGRARLTRRLIMDLVFIVIYEAEYSIAFGWNPARSGMNGVNRQAGQQIREQHSSVPTHAAEPERTPHVGVEHDLGGPSLGRPLRFRGEPDLHIPHMAEKMCRG
jgi:hypothetical protein